MVVSFFSKKKEEQKTTLNFAELKNWKKISATPYSAGSFPLTSVRAPSSSAAGSSPSFHTASTFQAPSSFGHEKEKEKVKRKHMLMRGGGYERRVKTEESDKKILSLFGCGIDDILQQELWVSQKFLDGPLVPSSLVILCQTILNVCDDAQVFFFSNLIIFVALSFSTKIVPFKNSILPRVSPSEIVILWNECVDNILKNRRYLLTEENHLKSSL